MWCSGRQVGDPCSRRVWGGWRGGVRGGEHDGAGQGEPGAGQGPRHAGHPGPVSRVGRLAAPPRAGFSGGGGGLCASFCLNCNYLIIDYTRL